MKGRLIVAAVGIPLLLVILLVCPAFVTALSIMFLTAVGANELLNTTKLVSNRRMVIYSQVMAVLVSGWSYAVFSEYCSWLWDSIGSPMLIAATLIFLFITLLFLESLAAYPELKFSTICYCFFAGVLIPFSLSAITRLLVSTNGRFLVLIPIIIPFISDAGAYFAGRFFGEHKLAPVLSPKKTREGAVGGVISGIVSMVLYCLIMQFCFKFHVNYGFAVIYGIIGSLISIIGDLSFSMIKRECGIKDYGTLFRAHGGVLDRFDSMLFAAPLVELFLIFIPVVF